MARLNVCAYTNRMSQHNILVDTGEQIILATHPHLPAIVFVSEWTLDTTFVPAADDPHHIGTFPLIQAPPAEVPQWSWNPKSRTVVPTNATLITPTIRSRAELAFQKISTVSFMIHRINYLRSKVNTGFLAQEAIYLKKYLEAQRLVDHTFSEEAVAQSPYTVSYADLCGISVEKAAEEILLQTKLDHEFLAKTELLRLRFFSRLRRATSHTEIKDILAAFRGEASS